MPYLVNTIYQKGLISYTIVWFDFLSFCLNARWLFFYYRLFSYSLPHSLVPFSLFTMDSPSRSFSTSRVPYLLQQRSLPPSKRNSPICKYIKENSTAPNKLICKVRKLQHTRGKKTWDSHLILVLAGSRYFFLLLFNSVAASPLNRIC